MRELIAEFMHNLWSDWMKYLFSRCVHLESIKLVEDNGVESVVIPMEYFERWTRQSNTQYKLLSEEEKNSDREIADRLFEYIVDIGKKKQEPETTSDVPVDADYVPAPGDIPENENPTILFGDVLKHLRVSNNIDQLTLAKHLDLSQSAISQFENNLRMPSEDNITKIAGLFNISVEDLVGECNVYNSAIRNMSGLNPRQMGIVNNIMLEFKRKGN